MVVFGGLEFVVGGYLLHRYNKGKGERRRTEEERCRREFEEYRRTQNGPFVPRPQPPHHTQTYPGPQRKDYFYGQHSQSQLCLPQHGATFPMQSPQMYPPRPPQPQLQVQTQYLPPAQTQTPFPLQNQPLRRQNSVSSISHIPVANGTSPSLAPPPLPLRPSSSPGPFIHPPQQQFVPVQAVPQPYPPRQHLAAPSPTPLMQPPANIPNYNTGLHEPYPSVLPMSANPIIYTPVGPAAGRHTVDDSLQPYGVHSRPRPQRADDDGEDDPPPPYAP